MNSSDVQTEIRQVTDFDQVFIRGITCSAQLFITQGERERLTIEAPSEYLRRLRSEVKDGKLTLRMEGSWLEELGYALATDSDKPHVLYRLDVRALTCLHIQCAYSIYAARIETPHLRLRLDGAGDFRLDQLSAQTLDLHQSGACSVQISGDVHDQTVVLNGAGSYNSPGLCSQRARVRILGTGAARLHVVQQLDVTLRGAGLLEYSGSPAVFKRISGPGQILQTVEAEGQRG